MEKFFSVKPEVFFSAAIAAAVVVILDGKAKRKSASTGGTYRGLSELWT